MKVRQMRGPPLAARRQPGRQPGSLPAALLALLALQAARVEASAPLVGIAYNVDTTAASFTSTFTLQSAKNYSEATVAADYACTTSYTCLGAKPNSSSTVLTMLACASTSFLSAGTSSNTVATAENGAFWYNVAGSTVGYASTSSIALANSYYRVDTFDCTDSGTFKACPDTSRLSWYLANGIGGYRAGSSVYLWLTDPAGLVYQKVAYCEAVPISPPPPSPPPPSPPPPSPPPPSPPPPSPPPPSPQPPHPPPPPSPPPPLPVAAPGQAELNVTAITPAAIQVTVAALSGMNASAAATQQITILESLTATNLSAAAQAEGAASLVLAVLNATATVSAGTQAAALSVLSAVAGAPLNLSGSAAQSITAALSAVASSASVNNPAALAQVQGVLETLGANTALSLLSQLAAGGPAPAPATTSTPTIQTLVQVDPPGSDRLTTQPISAPGSPSLFEPMPVGLLPTSSPVVTTFFSLKFDPNAGTGPAQNTTGVTRLAFSTADGSPIEVENASTPIFFTLPPVDVMSGPDPSHARCQFWDVAAQPPAYSTRGCVGVPSPAPPGHALQFTPGFTAPTDAAIALAWNISGAMMAAGFCNVKLLDCNAANPGVVWPDPSNPFAAPAVACPARTNGTTGPAPVLRVYSGSRCELWRPNNTAGCWWDNVKQAFSGAGCVTSGGPTQCACRHLTDFASARAPNIPTCSLADLTSFSAADIVTKLRTLFIVVISFFGAMNIGAAVGWLLDARERRAVVQQLQAPATGFQEDVADPECWTWTFALHELPDELAAPSGSAVMLSQIMGVPFVRLRAALPDELLPSPLGNALGRRDAFSLNAMSASLSRQSELVQSMRMSESMRRSSSKLLELGEIPSRRSSTLRATADAAERATLERFVGTALVLSFLQVSSLLPVVELARRRSAAVRHFDGVLTPAGWDFLKTQTDFVTLLSSGVLNMRRRWLQRARLWRLILGQAPDGSWAASSTTEFALEARFTAELDELKPTLLARAKDFVCNAGDDDGDNDTNALDAVVDSWQQATGGNVPPPQLADDERAAARISTTDSSINDCPLTCHAAAIAASMPKRLAALQAAEPGVDVARVWTTLCCCASLQRLNASWVWGDGDLYADPERTIVDAGREWVEAQAAEHARLGEALADGAMRRAAKRTTALWHRACEQRIAELRRGEAITSHMALSHLHRSSTEIMRAFVTKHGTFATFLSEPLDGLQRWQMWVILVSLIIAQLLVNIWMFYAKGVNCCAALRLMLDSGPDGGNCPPVGPCRGFEGNCGQVAQQFATVPVLPDYPAGLADWVCTEFPNEDAPVDSFIVGLISIAICIPVTVFITSCFAIANDSEAPESWLEWTSGWRKLVFGFNAHRRWHWTRDKPPVRHVRWYCRSIGAPPPETVANLFHSLWAWLTRTDPPWVVEAREAEEEAAFDDEQAAAKETPGDKPAESGATTSSGGGEAQIDGDEAPPGGGSDTHSVTSSVRSAQELAAHKRRLMVYGLIGTAISWTLFVWFIFTYGMLVYRLLGEDAESEFARSWGVSYGLNAAYEWKDIASEAAKAAVVLLIMERLFLTRNSSWLEEHIDYLSLQALLFAGGSHNIFQQTRMFFAHTKRLAD